MTRKETELEVGLTDCTRDDLVNEIVRLRLKPSRQCSGGANTSLLTASGTARRRRWLLSKRALRRSHTARLIARRITMAFDREWSHRQLMIHVTTPKPCSCGICCNQRSYLGPTIQERKSELKEKEGDE